MSVLTMQTTQSRPSAHAPSVTVDWPVGQHWPDDSGHPPVGTSRGAWALIGAAAVATVIVAFVGALVSNDGSDPASAASAAAGPIVADDGLPVSLLDAAAVNRIMRAGQMAVDPALTAAKLHDGTSNTPECGGVSATANRGVYAGSGWVAAQTRHLREPGPTVGHEVFESAISFSSAEAAAKFVAAEAKRWGVCNGRYVTTTGPTAASQTRWVSTVSEQGGMLTAFSISEGGRGWGCQHALTARNNIVIDVEACSANVMQQGVAIAAALADRVH